MSFLKTGLIVCFIIIVVTSPTNSYGIDPIKLWNHSNSSEPFIVILEVTNGLRTEYYRKCFPNEMIGANNNVISGPLSPSLKFSLHKTRSAASPLTEPIEVAIPVPDSDVCIIVHGTYATAMKKYIPYAEPQGIKPETQTPQNIKRTMPLLVGPRP